MASVSEFDETEFDVRLSEKIAEADGVVRLVLTPVGGALLPAWQAGAHIDLLLPGGFVRQFSLCSDPADRTSWAVAVLKEPESRGGSKFIHEGLAVGDTLKVRGPRNHFALDPAPRYLFIAGGIGITPILPMLAAAEAAGAEFSLVYGGRTRDSMAFVTELVSRYGDRIEVCPQDEVGLLDLPRYLAVPQPDTLIYCCGPGPLLDAVEARTTSWPLDALHVERFAPKPVGEPVRSTGFEVHLARRDLTVQVPPGRSILACLDDVGVHVVSSCQEGTCGTCETAVLEGVVDHRDSVLTASERAANDTMMICCSRAVSSRLVLDL